MSDGTIVVVNPASANGRTGRRWPELAAKLRSRIGDFEAAFTKAPKEATSIVRQALRDGTNHVVSVGGDGTHNEVINGFFDGREQVAEGIKLSLIPTGTGGDLRRTVGLPDSPIDAIDYVITHELCHMAVPHHGPAFFDLLNRVLPDWQLRKQRLEQRMA